MADDKNPPKPAPAPSDGLGPRLLKSLRIRAAELKGTGAVRTCRLVQGRLARRIGPDRWIYRFFMIQGFPAEDDIAGRIKTEQGEYEAWIRYGRTRYYWVEIKTPYRLPTDLEAATFSFSHIPGLKRLIARLKGSFPRINGIQAILERYFQGDSIKEPVEITPNDTAWAAKIQRILDTALCFIHTRPGTNRAELCGGLAAELIHRGESVLVTGRRNHDLDEILRVTLNGLKRLSESTSDRTPGRTDILRLGASREDWLPPEMTPQGRRDRVDGKLVEQAAAMKKQNQGTRPTAR